MTAIDEILGALPIDQIAQQVGASPQDVQHAVSAAVPALLGGLGANAQDPAGAASLLEALGRHEGDLLGGGLDLGRIDTNDGSAITSHIFGDNEDAVVSQLGGLSGSGGSSLGGSLIKKLLPILAPIVLSWIAKRVLGGGGSGAPAPQQPGPASTAGPGSLDDLLKDVLGGAVSGGAAMPVPGSTPSGGMDAGSILTDLLGGLLGGGRR